MKITDCLDIHPDIIKAETEYPHGNGNIIKIVSPGYGVFGGRPKGTVTIVYECDCNFGQGFKPIHEHQALYGPKVVHFSDDCAACGLSKYRSHKGHEYSPMGEEVLNYEHMTLYAD